MKKELSKRVRLKNVTMDAKKGVCRLFGLLSKRRYLTWVYETFYAQNNVFVNMGTYIKFSYFYGPLYLF